MTPIRYRNIRFRIIITLIASVYILLHGHTPDVIGRAFFNPSFYLALLISYPLTLFLVYVVHRATLRLDRMFDWRRQPVKRAIWQTALGIVLPAALDLGFISIYAGIIGENFDRSKFLLVDFPIIVAFVVLINAYYVIRYLLLTEPPAKAEKDLATILVKEYKLSRREMEVVQLILKDHSYSEIARALFLAEGTVSKHASNIFKKTNTAGKEDFKEKFAID